MKPLMYFVNDNDIKPPCKITIKYNQESHVTGTNFREQMISSQLLDFMSLTSQNNKNKKFM